MYSARALAMVALLTPFQHRAQEGGWEHVFTPYFRCCPPRIYPVSCSEGHSYPVFTPCFVHYRIDL